MTHILLAFYLQLIQYYKVVSSVQCSDIYALDTVNRPEPNVGKLCRKVSHFQRSLNLPTNTTLMRLT